MPTDIILMGTEIIGNITEIMGAIVMKLPVMSVILWCSGYYRKITEMTSDTEPFRFCLYHEH